MKILIVKLKLNSACFYLVCLYIPSGSPAELYDSNTSGIQLIFDKLSLIADDTLMVFGDFKMPKVVWNSDVDNENVLYPSNLLRYQENILQCLFCANLSQINHYENYMGRLLGLVFANDSDQITIFESDLLMV